MRDKNKSKTNTMKFIAKFYAIDEPDGQNKGA
jgi:hypothetical protein